MARGTQLLQMVAQLREELGRSNSVAVGIEDVQSLKTKLSRTQELLYDEYDWPHLISWHDRKLLQAGERFYDFPLTLNYDRILDGTPDDPGVVLWWNNIATPLLRGITWQHYSTFNPDDGVRVAQVLRWDVRDTQGTENPQVEVWPLPSSNEQYIQMRGVRKLRPLVADSDRADLDDRLIVLYAAAELLAKSEDPSASMIAGLAKSRMQRLKGRSMTNTQPYRMGMGPAHSIKPSFVIRTR